MRSIAIIALGAACGSGTASTERRRVGNADVAPFPGSPWAALFELDRRFELVTGFDDPPLGLTAVVDQVRPLGDARVARLLWRAGVGRQLSPTTLGTVAAPGPHRVVEAPRGVAFFSDDASDDQIAAALASPSTYWFPLPSEARPELDGPQGETARWEGRDDGAVVCVSVEQPAPGGEVCVSAAVGLVSVAGVWSPDGELYERARAVE